MDDIWAGTRGPEFYYCPYCALFWPWSEAPEEYDNHIKQCHPEQVNPSYSMDPDRTDP